MVKDDMSQTGIINQCQRADGHVVRARLSTTRAPGSGALALLSTACSEAIQAEMFDGLLEGHVSE